MGSVLAQRRSRYTMSAFVCGLDVHRDSSARSSYADLAKHARKHLNAENVSTVSFLLESTYAYTIPPLFLQKQKKAGPITY